MSTFILRFLAVSAAFAIPLAPTDARAADDDDADARTVIVHITSSAPVVLERQYDDSDSEHAGARGKWAVACTSPCDELLPVDATYRIGGAHVATSRAFHLPQSADGHVDLRVEPGGEAATAFGVVGVVAGAATLVGGLLFGAQAVAANASADCGNAANADSCGTASSQRSAAAIAMSAGGVALTIAGAIALAVSGTSVERRAGAPVRDAYLRRSELRGPGWQPPNARALAPILSFSF